MKIPSADFDLAALAERIAAPSCEERAATVTESQVAAYASAMARRGYRHTAQSLEAVRLYLAGYGLLLMGDAGTGKTFFFAAIGKPLTFRSGEDDSENIIHPYPMIDTVGRKIDEIREWFAAMQYREIVIDDIGAEAVFNEYGNRFEILPWLLDLRLRSPMRTHFTTNLTAKELQARYGARVVDRLHQMAAAVTLAGKSNRRTIPNARVVATIERARERRARQQQTISDSGKTENKE